MVYAKYFSLVKVTPFNAKCDYSLIHPFSYYLTKTFFLMWNMSHKNGLQFDKSE